MPAFTPSQQTVLLEFARLAVTQMEDLRKTLAQTSARIVALEELLLRRGVVTKEDVARSTLPSSETAPMDKERAAALHQVLRRILSSDGAG